MSRLDYLGDPWDIENPDWQSWFGGGDCRHTDVGAGRGGRVGVFGETGLRWHYSAKHHFDFSTKTLGEKSQ